MQNKVDKEAWIAMFRELGLNDDLMKKWHGLFQKRHPEGHQSFLEWLGVSSDEITKIREYTR